MDMACCSHSRRAYYTIFTLVGPIPAENVQIPVKFEPEHVDSHSTVARQDQIGGRNARICDQIPSTLEISWRIRMKEGMDFQEADSAMSNPDPRCYDGPELVQFQIRLPAKDNTAK
jgi:hypothetical protein